MLETNFEIQNRSFSGRIQEMSSKYIFLVGVFTCEISYSDAYFVLTYLIYICTVYSYSSREVAQGLAVFSEAFQRECEGSRVAAEVTTSRLFEA